MKLQAGSGNSLKSLNSLKESQNGISAYYDFFTGKIFTRNQQLIISREEQEDVAIPTEDIATLMLESQRVTITNAALAKLSEARVVVYTCDAKHMPCGIFTSYHQHSRKTAVLHKQIKLATRAKKQYWKQIVQQKIQNQAVCLEYFTEADAGLKQIAKAVKSGDSTNQEAVAAAKYFCKLFGNTFCRDDESITNAALNYGYSILREAMARFVVQYGLEAALGLQHNNQLNAFNLVDDLMEPYRPFIDSLVMENITSWKDKNELEAGVKRRLYAVLQEDVVLNECEMTVYSAMEQTVKSLAGCLNGETENLLLPVLEQEETQDVSNCVF